MSKEDQQKPFVFPLGVSFQSDGDVGKDSDDASRSDSSHRSDSRRPGTIRRVFVAGRLDAFSAAGGGEIQMDETCRALDRLGEDARRWRPWEDRLGSGDVLHLFGSLKEFLPAVESARRSGAAVCISTIAWFSLHDPLRVGGPMRRLAATARFTLRRIAPRIDSWRRRLYHLADRLLPNSQAEAEQLVRHFQVPRDKIHVVPNAADPRLAMSDPEPFRRLLVQLDLNPLMPVVLCPARIEPRKNQLALIRSLSDTGVSLVLIGDPVAGHESYADRCEAAAGENVRFLPRIPHDDPLLGSALAAASCLALCSWFETPGLAAIEAAMTGTPLVLPTAGCAREYFGPLARYVKPDRISQIRDAVFEAISGGSCDELATIARETFCWENAAEVTRTAYLAALGQADRRVDTTEL